MLSKLLPIAAGLMLATSPSALFGQETNVSDSQAVPSTGLTFERVYASPSLNGFVPRLPKLSPDGRFLAVLRYRPEDSQRYDLWAFDRQTGEWSMLVDSEKLGGGQAMSETEKMHRERLGIVSHKGIVSYDWSADGKGILVPLEGKLYLAGIDGNVRELSGTGEGEALTPMLSETGKYVSFLRDNRLWVGDLSGTAQPITPSEGELVHWGEAEFIAQEEMDRHVGYWWSPDDSRIAVQRYDDAPVAIWTRAAIGASGTTTFEQRYPAAGSANVDVSLFVMNPGGGNRVQVDLGADKDIYLARVDWAPDGKKLYVQRLNRVQDRLDLLEVDPVTGTSSVLLSEHAAKGHWINLTDNYRFLGDGSLIWWSERDGFGHLYRFNNGKWTQLTKGDWMVTAMVGVDQTSRRLYFVGTKDDVTEPQVYAIDYTKPGAPQRLTELGHTNTAVMDRGGKALMITRSSPTQPSQVYLADNTGKRLTWVEENKIDASHPYASFIASHREPEYGTIKGSDGTTLYYKMITPDLEPGKRYPVFFEHYGGPHSQQVFKRWGGSLEQAIVDKGYVYFVIDNRGSANRGVEFEKQIYRAMGSVEVEDQKAGAEYLKTLPFVDADKIGIYGWSYGGYMTLKQMQADPGLYAAGISGAPVTKWELYDTAYTERYMGTPQVDAEAYGKAAAIEDAAKMTDPLLIIHGMADDNVFFENSSELIARLQKENRPFEMMLYPGETHRSNDPQLMAHRWNTIFGFLAKHGVAPAK